MHRPKDTPQDVRDFVEHGSIWAWFRAVPSTIEDPETGARHPISVKVPDAEELGLEIPIIVVFRYKGRMLAVLHDEAERIAGRAIDLSEDQKAVVIERGYEPNWMVVRRDLARTIVRRDLFEGFDLHDDEEPPF